jgi:hypothetical protein
MDILLVIDMITLCLENFLGEGGVLNVVVYLSSEL